MSAYHPLYYDESGLDYKKQAADVMHEIPTLAKSYLLSLFPIIKWLPKYNRHWFLGDIIAAVTIGCVVIPQGMAYAKIATLPVQFGLYSSFTGVLLYCFFATSKDITIGPVSVMSLLMAEILADIHKEDPTLSNVTVAASLAMLAGFIALGIGLFRLGFIIDFISGPSIAGFMSGSALTIGIGQLAGLFGIPNINTREEAYLVLGNTIGALGHSQLDAAFGLVILALLYSIRYGTEYFSKKYPRYKRPLFFLNTSRSVLMVIFSTLVAYGVCKGHATPPIKILLHVPSGLHDIGVPDLSSNLIGKVAFRLPVVVLILVLEHVAIAKSFGRLNDYVIDPNQEFVAIGVANIVGSFFSSYPATGSFSRTAIKAKAGVRSPLAGVFSGVVVLFAIYVLTPAFYYIPNAALSAIIIHAVADLFSGPKVWKQFWNVSPFELLIFVLGVVITFFTSVEIGIYVSVGFSLFVLLARIARPRFSVLGRVPIYTDSTNSSEEGTDRAEIAKYVYVPVDNTTVKSKNAILPMPPGVVVVRLEEAYTYPNASFITDKMIEAAKSVTKRGGEDVVKGGRAWNDTYDDAERDRKATLPLLKAVVVDFIAVNHFDSTGLQGLMAARATLDRYAGRPVEWHFANINNAKIRHSLFVGGFGGRTPSVTETQPLGMVPTLNSTQGNVEGKINDSEIIDSGIELTRLNNEEPTDFIHFDLDTAVYYASRGDGFRTPTQV
eukprot:Phypoly_transcript_01800.p1 GENE.Phypoly_transcript_01800~~Phypoly_transcript_01800.p1  ORF type:complete len:721 (-),score=109.97 Phypoly_transcript_01800:174-2336(-)